MKVVISHQRNRPTTVSGYGLTVSYTYYSFNPSEIDEIEKQLPKGILIIGEDEPRVVNLPINEETVIRKE